jgi:hypothetical protein
MFGRTVSGTKTFRLEKKFFPRQDGGNGPCYDLNELGATIGRAKGEILAGMDGAQQLKVKFAGSFRHLSDGALLLEFHYEHPPITAKSQPEEPEHRQLRHLIAKYPQVAKQLVQGT